MFSAPPITFHREPLAQAREEVWPFLHQHWEELALNQDRIKLDVDHAFYDALEKAGALRVYTVREMGRLSGYAVYFVRFHPHYRTKKWASSDILWMERRLRTNRGIFRRTWRRLWYWLNPQLVRATVGARFLAFIEESLRKEGVNVMHTTAKVRHPALARVLCYLGHQHIESGHSKIIGA